jgi:hypothetical protein
MCGNPIAPSLVLLSVLAAGCAAVRPPSSSTGEGLAAAGYSTEIVPPKIELPEWQAPRLDLSIFQPDARQPSNDRDWVNEQKVLAQAEFDGDKVHVRNVRNAEYYSYRDCIVDYYDKTYDLTKIKSVDFVMIPFADNRAIAHTLLSFGFEGGDQVGVSVEVRLEKGESYSAAVGLLGQFELMYVVCSSMS